MSTSERDLPGLAGRSHPFLAGVLGKYRDGCLAQSLAHGRVSQGGDGVPTVFPSFLFPYSQGCWLAMPPLRPVRRALRCLDVCRDSRQRQAPRMIAGFLAAWVKCLHVPFWSDLSQDPFLGLRSRRGTEPHCLPGDSPTLGSPCLSPASLLSARAASSCGLLWGRSKPFLASSALPTLSSPGPDLTTCCRCPFLGSRGSQSPRVIRQWV